MGLFIAYKYFGFRGGLPAWSKTRVNYKTYNTLDSLLAILILNISLQFSSTDEYSNNLCKYITQNGVFLSK
ncbi:hypothetical protein MACH07_24440 [Flagellimonas marinaquae]|uniref:Uncharacterized protein n=1 Tax=Flagellimonas marinaquae TaxID=254955 RepID=A0AA48HFS2_9FLAO|nr:hypothetical protein MACH07_24440 [Allomuricauda aquimarina]